MQPRSGLKAELSAARSRPAARDLRCSLRALLTGVTACAMLFAFLQVTPAAWLETLARLAAMMVLMAVFAVTVVALSLAALTATLTAILGAARLLRLGARCGRRLVLQG